MDQYQRISLLYLQLKNGVNPDKNKGAIDSLSDRKRKAFEATQTNNLNINNGMNSYRWKNLYLQLSWNTTGVKANKIVSMDWWALTVFNHIGLYKLYQYEYCIHSSKSKKK